MAAVRRIPVTLLEIILVMAFLALASGMVAIGFRKAVAEQRFRSEVGLVANQLRLAQDLMLILGTDVLLHFEVDKDKKGIKYEFKIETVLPKSVQLEIFRKKPLLRTIKGIFFEDQLFSEKKEKGLTLRFLSNGAVMSKGIIRLASTDDAKIKSGALESYICLAGYPKPIASSDTLEDAEQSCFVFSEGLDALLTRDTVLRLPEKLKQPDPDTVKAPEEVSGQPGDNKGSGQSANKPREAK